MSGTAVREELMTDVMTSLPPQVWVQRGATAERVPFGPTDSIRFMADGGPGLPEFYEERAGRGDGPPLHSHPWSPWELVYVVESNTAHAVGIGLSGGRFPSLQRKAAPLMAAEGGPPMHEVMALASEHGTAILGPPLSVDPAL